MRQGALRCARVTMAGKDRKETSNLFIDAMPQAKPAVCRGIHMILLMNLILTGLLGGYAGWRCRKRGMAKAMTAGTGVCVVALYLDGIFFLIAQSAFGENAVAAQGLGFFVSKSILAAMQEMPGDKKEESMAGRGAIAGWQYLDGLTLAVTLFFGFLAGGCIRRTVCGMKTGDAGQFGTTLLLTCFLLLLLSFYSSLSWHQRRERERRMRLEEEEKRREADLYLERVADDYRRMRELWHDLKNHINLLNLLLQEEKYGEMAAYLQVFGADVDSLSLPEKSGNPVVDALLSDKIAKARREQIEVELSLCDLSALFAKPNEICSILGNLLDNALEANRKVEKGRYLKITCREREECCYIRIQNAVAGAAKRQGNLFMTDKTDRDNLVGHGLGLRSTERMIHGCGGELLLDSKEECFTAVVRLPKRS